MGFLGSEVANSFFCASDVSQVRVRDGNVVIVVSKTMRSFLCLFEGRSLDSVLVKHLLGFQTFNDILHKLNKVVEGLFSRVVHEWSTIDKQDK